MKAQVTLYINPNKRSRAMNSLKDSLGNEIVFYNDQSKLLSWIGESTINIADQNTAFELERELQRIPDLSDIEIIVEDTVQEAELNLRFSQLNHAINQDKSQYPKPSWYKDAINLNDALLFAEEESSKGNNYYDPMFSKSDIALIDTGYSLHPKINGIDRINFKNFISGENPDDPLDTLENTRPLPIAWGGHGTSCSGLLMGQKTTIPQENRIKKENAFYDDLVEGILPKNLNVIHYRVSKNIISFTSRMPAAINHIISQDKIKVISMSHATLFNRKSVYAATRAAYEKGIIFVAAPGSHVFASRKVFTYPAKYNETISPAASTYENIPWRLTHGGPEVDLCAPGFEIYIPWPFKTKDKKFGYAFKWSEGSSFAVPIVACAASLWRMHHGDNLNRFSPMEQVELFRNILKKTATPFTNPVDSREFGTGVINFLAMLKYPIPRRKSHKRQIWNTPLEPERFFFTNKQEASLKRELEYLKVNQFVYNQAKAIPEMDFYEKSGTPQFQNWIREITRNASDKINAIDSIVESPFKNL